MSCCSCGDRFTGILTNCKYCLESVCDSCFNEYHHCDECESLCGREETRCDFCGYSGEKHKKVTVSTPTDTQSYHDNYSDSYNEEGRCFMMFEIQCIPRVLSACCKCVKEDPTVLSCLKIKTEHTKRIEHKICDICKLSDICLEQLTLKHKNTKRLMVVSQDGCSIDETYSLLCKGCTSSHGKLAFLVCEQLNLVRLHRLNCDFCCQCLDDIKSNIPYLISDLRQLVMDYLI